MKSHGFGKIHSNSGGGFNVFHKGETPHANVADGVVLIADGNTVHEYYHWHGGVSADVVRVWPIDGDGHSGPGGPRIGVSASGVAGLFGLMRGDEINTPGQPIQHVHQIVLSYAAPPQTKAQAVWPATSIDKYCDKSCSGNVPYGALLAVPPTVNVDKLGLSEPGARLAHALQDYGVYVVDTTRGPNANMRADQYVDPKVQVALAKDMQKIYPTLRMITNNAKDQLTSGGGTPRAENCGIK